MKRKRIRSLIKFLAGTLLIYGILAFIANAIVQFHFLPKFEQRAAEIERFLPAIQEDSKLINANPIFVQQPRTKNAAEFISQNLVEYESTSAQTATSKRQLLEYFVQDHRDWNQSKKSFHSFLTDPRLSEFSTEWMNQITEFDHWDPSAVPSFREHIEKASRGADFSRVGFIATLPWGEYSSTLSNLAKVHVLRLHLEGRTIDAFKAIRQLSYLMHSSGSFIDDRFAIRLLSIERKLAEHLKPKGWRVVSEELSRAYSRLAWSWNGVFYLAWFKGLPENISLYLKPEFGVCGPISEMLISSPVAYYKLLVPRLPLEPGLSVYFSRARQLIGRLLPTCGLQALMPLLNPAPEGQALGYQTSYDMLAEFAFFTRGIIGLMLLDLGQWDSMKRYREAE